MTITNITLDIRPCNFGAYTPTGYPAIKYLPHNDTYPDETSMIGFSTKDNEYLLIGNLQDGASASWDITFPETPIS